MSERRPAGSEIARRFVKEYLHTKREMAASAVMSSATALLLEETKVSPSIKKGLVLATSVIAYQASLMLRSKD